MQHEGDWIQAAPAALSFIARPRSRRKEATDAIAGAKELARRAGSNGMRLRLQLPSRMTIRRSSSPPSIVLTRV